MDFLTLDALTSLAQIVMIDLVLAGDNAVVIGLAVAGLPAAQRSRAILAGIAAATVLRIVLALSTQLLLGFGGALLVAGGLLLLYVCWRMARELRNLRRGKSTEDATGNEAEAPKSLGQAVWQIVVADASMSLDNVLAVAGAAGGHQGVLVVGLVLSIALMGLAASLIARLLQRHPWIAYVGLAIILYVAVEMILKGVDQLRPGIVPAFLV